MMSNACCFGRQRFWEKYDKNLCATDFDKTVILYRDMTKIFLHNMFKPSPRRLGYRELHRRQTDIKIITFWILCTAKRIYRQQTVDRYLTNRITFSILSICEHLEKNSITIFMRNSYYFCMCVYYPNWNFSQLYIMVSYILKNPLFINCICIEYTMEVRI